MTLAGNNPPEEIRRGALKAANGDTLLAFIVLSNKTATILDGTNVLQGDLELCERRSERFEKYFGYDDKTWLDKTWDSNITKVMLFITGIWLGTRIVYSVN